jgi:hypothetical protein
MLTCGLSAQSITEAAAAAAGASIGGAAGKKVSDGFTAVMEKVGKQTAKAAEDKDAKSKGASKSGPLLEVGPGAPVEALDSVPPPPPARRAARRPAPPVRTPAPAAILPEPSRPAPVATADDLRGIAQGMNREEVLKIGAPAVRITMAEEGRLVEVYRYMAGERHVGMVQLSNGAVSNVQVP